METQYETRYKAATNTYEVFALGDCGESKIGIISLSATHAAPAKPLYVGLHPAVSQPTDAPITRRVHRCDLLRPSYAAQTFDAAEKSIIAHHKSWLTLHGVEIAQ